jgi:hypothetical protein
MIFLSTQPDQFYFLWQLQLQLFNFSSLNIPRDQIHVLIGYDPLKGLSPEFSSFIVDCKVANFYTYPDLRSKKDYSVSIRPHLIKQHFSRYKNLEKTTILYHDADIFFRELPQFSSIEGDDNWYVADTRSYLNSSYIINYGGQAVLERMCGIVGIAKENVIANDQHAGGAQYLMKGTTIEFWEKVENDCEEMYSFLKNHRDALYEESYLKSGNVRSSFKGIHWYAEMWVLFWNALLSGHKVKICEELDFCWPNDTLDKWYKKNILHYSGNYKNNDKVFDKNRYRNFSPFYEEFSRIDPQRCSIKIVELIRSYNEKIKRTLPNIADTVICFNMVHMKGVEKYDNLAAVIKWINTQFRCQVAVLDNKKSENDFHLPLNCTYIKYKDWDRWLESECADNKIFIFFNRLALLDREVFLTAIHRVRNEEVDYILLNRDNMFIVDNLFVSIFQRIIDIKVLELHKGKFRKLKEDDQEAVVFVGSHYVPGIIELLLANISHSHINIERNKARTAVINTPVYVI